MGMLDKTWIDKKDSYLDLCSLEDNIEYKGEVIHWSGGFTRKEGIVYWYKGFGGGSTS